MCVLMVWYRVYVWLICLLDDLQHRFNEMEQAVAKLKEASDGVRATVSVTQYVFSMISSPNLMRARSLDDTERIPHRAQDYYGRAATAANLLESRTIFFVVFIFD